VLQTHILTLQLSTFYFIIHSINQFIKSRTNMVTNTATIEHDALYVENSTNGTQNDKVK